MSEKKYCEYDLKQNKNATQLTNTVITLDCPAVHFCNYLLREAWWQNAKL